MCQHLRNVHSMPLPVDLSDKPARIGTGAHAVCLVRAVQDGETLNNYVEVAGDDDPGAAAARARMLSENAPLTYDERARLETHFGVRS